MRLPFFLSRTSQKRISAQHRARLRVEQLETRNAPAGIQLELVALHEFGHSLGLDHDATSAVSILDPYYNDNYDINYFLSGQDPAVARLKSLYSNPATSPWKDALDPLPGNNRVDITYSFMKDGDVMDGRRSVNTLFATMNARFGSPSVWEPVFTTALGLWEQVSGGLIHFVAFNGGNGEETGYYNFNTRGAAQDDSRFGDIRIGAHRMDGTSRVLAHAYYPSSSTAGGDAHLDNAEAWTLTKAGTPSTAAAAASSSNTISVGTGSTSSGTGNKKKGPEKTNNDGGDDLFDDNNSAAAQNAARQNNNLAVLIAETARSMTLAPVNVGVVNPASLNVASTSVSQTGTGPVVATPTASASAATPRPVAGWMAGGLTEAPEDALGGGGRRIATPTPSPAPVTPPATPSLVSSKMWGHMSILEPKAIFTGSSGKPDSGAGTMPPGETEQWAVQSPAAVALAFALGCSWWSPYTMAMEEKRQGRPSIRW